MMIEGNVIYFGDSWGTAALDGARQIDTPVGEPCMVCHEPIAAGDRGFTRAILRDVDTAEVGYVHAECELLSTNGHRYGICTCTGYDTTSRTSARLLWQRIADQRRRGRPAGWSEP